MKKIFFQTRAATHTVRCTIGAVLLLFSALLTTQSSWLVSEGCAQQTEEISLIVNSKLKVEKIKKRDLALIFSGRRRAWGDKNYAIQLILFPEGSPEMSWLSKHLKMPEHLVRRFIFRRVYQGTMRQPIEVSSTEDAIRALETYPGSIVPLRMTSELKLQILSENRERLSLRVVKLVP